MCSLKREVKVNVTKCFVGREELMNVFKLTKVNCCTIINGLWDTKLNATAKRKLLTPDGRTDRLAIRSKLYCIVIQRVSLINQNLTGRWHEWELLNNIKRFVIFSFLFLWWRNLELFGGRKMSAWRMFSCTGTYTHDILLVSLFLYIWYLSFLLLKCLPIFGRFLYVLYRLHTT